MEPNFGCVTSHPARLVPCAYIAFDTIDRSGRSISRRCRYSSSSSTSPCSLLGVSERYGVVTRAMPHASSCSLNEPHSHLFYAVYQHLAFTYWPYLPHIGDCAGDSKTAIFSIVLIAIFLGLFTNFYAQTYTKTGAIGNGKDKDRDEVPHIDKPRSGRKVCGCEAS